jgi:heme o synthase
MKPNNRRIVQKLGILKTGLQVRHLSLLASIAVFLTIVLGTSLSAAAGNTCPDWPLCNGTLLPPSGSAAQLDYVHRALTGLAFMLLIVATLAVFRNKKSSRIQKTSHGMALLAFGIALLMGASATLRESDWVGVLHLGVALATQAFILMGTVALFLPESNEKLTWRTPFAWLTLVTALFTLLVMVSGSFVALSGATEACSGWPLCNQTLFPDSIAGWINLGHRIVVLAAGVLMLLVLVEAYRRQRSQPATLTAATAAVVLFISQGLMGAVNAQQAYSPVLLGLHSATSAAIWASIVTMVALVGLSNRSAEDERLDIQTGAGRQISRLLLDFIMLTKPIVVALLLVTTFAGMLIGAKSWPGTALVFWTLLGGFLAAGGSGAINQYIDRADDLRMQRTSRRPIPAGRLTPAEGLAFGVGISLLSFYVMVALVNFTAALLTLAGIVYYVVLYSLLLKKTTAQNIVIGGGAGAIPPLVGWAAATGSLTIPSLLLFAVIFMWTPPHFWALAIVRRKDYARAGVPMLPVVRGEKETRWQVFIYSIELVALTLILPVFGLGSSIYLISAIVLGGMLLFTAYKVWRIEGNKIAWKMYRYSSMYLAFLFLALMIDRLLL